MHPYYYLGGGRGITQLSTGEPFFVNTRDRGIAIWIILAGIWETFVDDVLCALARPGDVFLDVGANMGYYTVKVGTRIKPGGRTYSFEPNPELFSCLIDNMDINSLAPTGKAYNVAVGAEPGWSVLRFTYENMGGGGVDVPSVHRGVPGRDGVTVPIARIDDLVPPDLKADLIKIDVEGFEPAAFEGMKDLLARSPDAAIVTVVAVPHWARFGDPMAALRQVAGSRRMYIIHHDGALEEVPPENLVGRLSADFVSYVLLLPDTPERLQQVSSFRRV